MSKTNNIFTDYQKAIVDSPTRDDCTAVESADGSLEEGEGET